MAVEALADLSTMADVLARCPGMKKEDVYYLEHRGYLRPVKQRHGRLERNFYTRGQVDLIAEIWRLKQEGLPPREAYRRAKQALSSGQLALWPEEALPPQQERSRGGSLAPAGD
jgi:hypothetical protein